MNFPRQCNEMAHVVHLTRRVQPQLIDERREPLDQITWLAIAAARTHIADVALTGGGCSR
jgi:hypothetical protein